MAAHITVFPSDNSSFNYSCPYYIGNFSFIWRWDDFMSPLLYINKTTMYPISYALKLFCDPSSTSDYGAMFAMATLSLLPAVIIFITLQKYLVEGIATSGIKG